MSVFNYRAEAELFPTKTRRSKSAPFAYRRFERAAHFVDRRGILRVDDMREVVDGRGELGEGRGLRGSNPA